MVNVSRTAFDNENYAKRSMQKRMRCQEHNEAKETCVQPASTLIGDQSGRKEFDDRHRRARMEEQRFHVIYYTSLLKSQALTHNEGSINNLKPQVFLIRLQNSRNDPFHSPERGFSQASMHKNVVPTSCEVPRCHLEHES
jgi:hypothetical protein